MEQELPEAFLLANTLVESKTVIKNEDNEDTGQQGESQNRRLDYPPKRFLSTIIHHWDCVANHDVAEEDNPDRDKSVEGEEKGAQEGSEETENFGNMVSAKN